MGRDQGAVGRFGRKASRHLEDLEAHRTLLCDELRGNRAGQWAIDLTDRFRLIVTVTGLELDVVRIEEVTIHHGH